MTPLRITVLGSGSVGLAVAASFARAAADVTMLARGPTVQQLRQEGITVTGVCGEHRIAPGLLRISDVDNPDPQDMHCDFLIVATKAYQVRDALNSLVQKIGPADMPPALLLFWRMSKSLCCPWSFPGERRTAPPCSRMWKRDGRPKSTISMVPSFAWGNCTASPHRLTMSFRVSLAHGKLSEALHNRF